MAEYNSIHTGKRIDSGISAVPEIQAETTENWVLLNTLDNRVRTLEQATPATTGWQPHPDWPDIKSMVDTGIMPWTDSPVGGITNIRYGYIVVDALDYIILPAGYEYYLSDGTHYDVSTSAITHAWDQTHDIPCLDGYKTRAVIVCATARAVSVVQSNLVIYGIASIYIYFGDCIISSLVLGGASNSTANLIIQAVHVSSKTTGSTSAINPPFASRAFSYCYSLIEIEIPTGTAELKEYCCAYCSSLVKITMPESIAVLAGYVFQSSYSLSEITIPNFVSTFNQLLFSNCYALKSIVISNNVSTIANNTFNGCIGLVSIQVPIGFKLSLTISASLILSLSSINNIADNYADMTGQTAPTLTLATAVVSRLSTEVLAKFAAKNITIASA